MAFTKLSIRGSGTDPVASSAPSPDIDIWAIFRALRDARSLFGLRPGHLQSLQAMLSFLKPGHGDTVFASNFEICRRVGGIDERTLRRHIDRFVDLGFMKRHDSPNRKRYRVRSSGGECISYGLSLTPLLERATELLTIAQEMENTRRDRIFLRKQILARLAQLEDIEPASSFLQEARKALRRKLSLSEYRALLNEADAQCKDVSTTEDVPNATELPANDGQIVRHHSMSEKEEKDIEPNRDSGQPNPQTLIAVCDQATAFSTQTLRGWNDIENHARVLAPMMGIHSSVFERASHAIGPRKASCAIFIILQLADRIRNLGAYFHSITLGNRAPEFDPLVVLEKLSRSKAAHRNVHRGGHA